MTEHSTSGSLGNISWVQKAALQLSWLYRRSVQLLHTSTQRPGTSLHMISLLGLPPCYIASTKCWGWEGLGTRLQCSLVWQFRCPLTVTCYHNTFCSINTLPIYMARYQTGSHSQTPFQFGNEAWPPPTFLKNSFRPSISVSEMSRKALSALSLSAYTTSLQIKHTRHTRMSEQHQPCMNRPLSETMKAGGRVGFNWKVNWLQVGLVLFFDF